MRGQELILDMGGCCAAVASCWWRVKKQRMALFFEKIAVAAAALEKQAICFQSIDENPIRLGNDVDMPRNLAKSVTVE
jgi:hypothetical protein